MKAATGKSILFQLAKIGRSALSGRFNHPVHRRSFPSEEYFIKISIAGEKFGLPEAVILTHFMKLSIYAWLNYLVLLQFSWRRGSEDSRGQGFKGLLYKDFISVFNILSFSTVSSSSLPYTPFSIKSNPPLIYF